MMSLHSEAIVVQEDEGSAVLPVVFGYTATLKRPSGGWRWARSLGRDGLSPTLTDRWCHR